MSIGIFIGLLLVHWVADFVLQTHNQEILNIMSKKKLISLEKHEEQKRETKRMTEFIRPNGIACPNCGEELVDTYPRQVLTSIPPKKDISCLKCNYRGFRTV